VIAAGVVDVTLEVLTPTSPFRDPELPWWVGLLVAAVLAGVGGFLTFSAMTIYSSLRTRLIGRLPQSIATGFAYFALPFCLQWIAGPVSQRPPFTYGIWSFLAVYPLAAAFWMLRRART
jgi:hypothetical protein